MCLRATVILLPLVPLIAHLPRWTTWLQELHHSGTLWGRGQNTEGFSYGRLFQETEAFRHLDVSSGAGSWKFGSSSKDTQRLVGNPGLTGNQFSLWISLQRLHSPTLSAIPKPHVSDPLSVTALKQAQSERLASGNRRGGNQPQPSPDPLV